MLFCVECRPISIISSVNVSILMLLWVTWTRTFLKHYFSQPTVCILYSLLSKAIHTGSAPGTITFNCQFATPILGATLLLYAAFINLNRFAVLSVCFFFFFFDCQLVFSCACFIVYFTSVRLL